MTDTTRPDGVLAAYAEGRISHVNRGLCPDEVAGHGSRDPDCPVCAALTAPASKPAEGGVVDERAAFEQALKETWQMVDPLRPPGTPGSYARGEHNGVIAALATIRANFDRAALAREGEAK